MEGDGASYTRAVTHNYDEAAEARVPRTSRTHASRLAALHNYIKQVRRARRRSNRLTRVIDVDIGVRVAQWSNPRFGMRGW